MKPRHFDILIIGAGLSGIGAACHLSRECPNGRFATLERRSRIGGTWDLFRYPGIRSDSDMFSFSFSFRPWKDLEFLAGGASIQRYINDTAEEYGILEHIHFGIDLHRANWCSTQKCWQLEGVSTTTGQPCHYTCHFLISCTGYYDHQQGLQPQLPGAERFRGDYIHPQQWPAKLDYHKQTIIVVGSGATAITLVPALAKAAKHVTMLQRSPGYILSIPSSDRLSSVLLKFLPKPWVFFMARWRNIKIQRWLFKASRRWPV
ncbi:NAD(P)/FAD-dependent oxidoreductase [uncultured Microbulbifer sp.]|uniref:flavin-containing monooxygenase n=1 Tax=uncultured Microbulbifer sp. TaxID=348147 RepID=UPI00260A4597|nr:NAD(P)/FAD-dependent oxidoreductase [uncultured Microbulbifer sp.]